MVEYIKIGEQDYPVQFSLNAMAKFGELTNRPFNEVLKISPDTTGLKDFIILIWCAFWDGARKEKKPFNVSIEEVGDWMTDNPGAFGEMTSMFQGAQPVGEPDKEVKKNEAPQVSP